MNSKGILTSGPGSGQDAVELAISKSIPKLRFLADLYDPDELTVQMRRYERIEAGFFKRFPERSAESPLFFSTPGRTELCGNHTDHNGGMVLAAAVNLDMVAAALPRPDSLVRIHSEGFGSFELDLCKLFPRPEEKASSQALVRGMAEGLSKLPGKESTPPERISSGEGSDKGSMAVRGFDACIDSRVPPGSGLSSSAAFEVLIGSIFAVFAGIEVSPARLAVIGRDAENRHFGKPSGLMDQTACALGSLALIDFADPRQAVINLLSFDPGEFGYNLAIVGTGDSHADLTEDYASIPGEMKAVAALLGKQRLCGISRSQLLSRAAEIRASCGDRAFLRAWHFTGETLRPLALAKALESKDIGAYLKVVRASGDSSYKYLQNIYPSSATFMDTKRSVADRGSGEVSEKSAGFGGAAKQDTGQSLAIALALTEDFLGETGACRIHGGGFAGTIQAYIPAHRKEEYQALMERHFGIHSLYWIKIRRYGAVCIEHPLRSSR